MSGEKKQDPSGLYAFPVSHVVNDGQTVRHILCTGMTLRQWYAGKALAGIMADPASADMAPEDVAQTAVRQADALLAALESGQ